MDSKYLPMNGLPDKAVGICEWTKSECHDHALEDLTEDYRAECIE